MPLVRASVRERWALSERPLRISAWASMILLTVIVSSGAAVRLTGSGLGCRDWPKCTPDSLVPTSEHALGGHTWIEFGNRLVTTPVAIAAILCVIFSLLRRSRRPDLTRLSVAMVCSVLAQAVLGGIAVRTDLSWWTVSGHLVLSMLALAIAVPLLWRVEREARGRPQRPTHDVRVVWSVRTLAAFGGAIVVIGSLATAAGPYAGGQGTGDDVPRMMVFGADTFAKMMTIHARLAAAFGLMALVVWIMVLRREDARVVLRPLTFVCLLVVALGAVGQIQYHLLAYPAWLIWVHVTLVPVLWNLCVWAYNAAGCADSPADISQLRQGGFGGAA